MIEIYSENRYQLKDKGEPELWYIRNTDKPALGSVQLSDFEHCNMHKWMHTAYHTQKQEVEDMLAEAYNQGMLFVDEELFHLVRYTPQISLLWKGTTVTYVRSEKSIPFMLWQFGQTVEYNKNANGL